MLSIDFYGFVQVHGFYEYHEYELWFKRIRKEAFERLDLSWKGLIY
jgi:hypothetical protein